MKELVAKCVICEKELYCLDGFFNGTFSNEHLPLCFECANLKEMEKSAD